MKYEILHSPLKHRVKLAVCTFLLKRTHSLTHSLNRDLNRGTHTQTHTATHIHTHTHQHTCASTIWSITIYQCYKILEEIFIFKNDDYLMKYIFYFLRQMIFKLSTFGLDFHCLFLILVIPTFH